MTSMDGVELGRLLRARRQEAGRTIASVAVEAGLSVPYIANLENGRGNPTLSALQRLTAALGLRLELGLNAGEESRDGSAALEATTRLARTPRALAVARRLAGRNRADVSVVTECLGDALGALAAVTGGDPDHRDLERLLDVFLLASERFDDGLGAE
jgi:transcriptional regulator with XRE-family HTH domain